jgi:hypothetical protein
LAVPPPSPSASYSLPADVYDTRGLANDNDKRDDIGLLD